MIFLNIYSLNSNISKNNLLEKFNTLFLQNKIKLKEDNDYLKLSFKNNKELILYNKENIDSFILLECI